MIALSLDDCRLKISFYKLQLEDATHAVRYLRKPDKQRERQLLTETRRYEWKAQRAAESILQRLYQDLAQYAKEALRELPQNMSDDDLAEALACNAALVKRYKVKLNEALDELGALRATPELLEEIRAEHSDLPPGAIDEVLMVLDNGTTVLTSGQVFTAKEIDLYHVQKVFGNVEASDDMKGAA